MIAMEVFEERYTNKKKLFSSVSKILRKNGHYNIEVEEDYDEVRNKEIIRYTLRFWFQDGVYKVIKGKDGANFQFLHMPYELDNYENEKTIPLKRGNILMYETEYEDEVWFTCITMLRGKKAMDSESAIGSTKYGSLSQMLTEGLIEKVLPDSSAAPAKKQAPIKRKRSANKTPPPETPIPQEDSPITEAPKRAEPETAGANAEVKEEWAKQREPEPQPEPEEYGSFEAIKNTIDLLKRSVGNIAHVSRYTNGEKIEGIRTLKISEFPYPSERLNYRPGPFIRLNGRWLEKAGFQAGDFVQVITINGMVLIVPVQPSTDL